MSFRSILVVILALICGVSAAFGIKQMQRPASEPSGDVEMVNVVVATVDLPRGETVSDAMVQLRPWPKAQVPPGALQSTEEAVGRMVQIPMLSNDVVVMKKVSGESEGSGLAPLVKPGMRAFTIPTPTPTASMAGFLLPGNRVDVYLTLNTQNTEEKDFTGGGLSVVLVNNIEIIASGKLLRAPAGNRVEQLRSVTLEVTPKQAALLSLAKNEGTLTLALRNGGDGDAVASGSDTATRKELRTLIHRGIPQPAPVPKQAVAKAKPAGPVEAPKPKTTTPEPPPRQQVVQVRIRTLRGTANGQQSIFLYPVSLPPKK